MVKLNDWELAEFMCDSVEGTRAAGAPRSGCSSAAPARSSLRAAPIRR